MKVMVTGFQPFGGEKVNPALEAVKALPETIAGAEIVKVEVPVVFGRAGEVVDEAIAKSHPDMVLCVGQAGGRTHMTTEFVGINYKDARIADNDGNQPIGEKIVEDGPDAYFSTLPVRAMVEAMKDAGIPAAVSYTAGTYVCNDLLYSVLHVLATKYPGVKGAFTHVPYLPEQARNLSATTPSMSLDDIVKALTAEIEAAVKGTEASGESAGFVQ